MIRCVSIPVFAVILRPESLEMLLRGSDNGEAFIPHALWEEGRDTSDTVARDAVRRAGGFELLLWRKREEGLTGYLNVIEDGGGDAMVDDLENTPSFACMAYEFRSIRVMEIDDRNGLERCGVLAVGVRLVGLCPSVGIGEFLERVEVRVVLLLKVERLGFKGV